jgi:hypothetical protein
LKIVEVKKTDTFKSFGCRFEKTIDKKEKAWYNTDMIKKALTIVQDVLTKHFPVTPLFCFLFMIAPY